MDDILHLVESWPGAKSGEIDVPEVAHLRWRPGHELSPEFQNLQLSTSQRARPRTWIDKLLRRRLESDPMLHVELRRSSRRVRLSAVARELDLSELPELALTGMRVPCDVLVGCLQAALRSGVTLASWDMEVGAPLPLPRDDGVNMLDPPPLHEPEPEPEEPSPPGPSPFPRGHVVTARITRVDETAARLALDDGVVGQLLSSELSWSDDAPTLPELFREGDLLELVVVGGRLGYVELSLRERIPRDSSENLDAMKTELEHGEDPQRHVDLLRHLAQVHLLEQRDPEAARDAVTQWLDVDPSDLRALRELGRIHRNNEEWMGYIDVLEHQAALTDEVDALIPLHAERARVFEEQLADTYSALEAWRFVLEYVPMHVEATEALERLEG